MESRPLRCLVFELRQKKDWLENLNRSSPCPEHASSLKKIREIIQLQEARMKREAAEANRKRMES